MAAPEPRAVVYSAQQLASLREGWRSAPLSEAGTVGRALDRFSDGRLLLNTEDSLSMAVASGSPRAESRIHVVLNTSANVSSIASLPSNAVALNGAHDVIDRFRVPGPDVNVAYLLSHLDALRADALRGLIQQLDPPEGRQVHVYGTELALLRLRGQGLDDPAVLLHAYSPGAQPPDTDTVSPEAAAWLGRLPLPPHVAGPTWAALPAAVKAEILASGGAEWMMKAIGVDWPTRAIAARETAVKRFDQGSGHVGYRDGNALDWLVEPDHSVLITAEVSPQRCVVANRDPAASERILLSAMAFERAEIEPDSTAILLETTNRLIAETPVDLATAHVAVSAGDRMYFPVTDLLTMLDDPAIAGKPVEIRLAPGLYRPDEVRLLSAEAQRRGATLNVLPALTDRTQRLYRPTGLAPTPPVDVASLLDQGQLALTAEIWDTYAARLAARPQQRDLWGDNRAGGLIGLAIGNHYPLSVRAMAADPTASPTLLRDINRTLTTGTATECQALARRLGIPGGSDSEYGARYRTGHDEGAAARAEVMNRGLTGMDATVLIVDRNQPGARSPAATAGYRDGFFTGSNPIGPAAIPDTPDSSPFGMARLRAGFWNGVAEESARLPSADPPDPAAQARISAATDGPTVTAFGTVFPAELAMSPGAPPALRAMGALAIAADWLNDHARVSQAIDAEWVSEAQVAQARAYIRQQLDGPSRSGSHILSFDPPSADRPLRITGVSRTSVDYDDVDSLHVLVLNSRFDPAGTADACEELRQTVDTPSAYVWCVSSDNDFGGGRLLEEMATVSNRVGATVVQDDQRMVLAGRRAGATAGRPAAEPRRQQTVPHAVNRCRRNPGSPARPPRPTYAHRLHPGSGRR